MNQFLNTIERLALKVSRSISLLAGLVLLWIVIITCVDVVGRYFFNSPLYAGAEIIILLNSSGVPWDRSDEYVKFQDQLDGCLGQELLPNHPADFVAPKCHRVQLDAVS